MQESGRPILVLKGKEKETGNSVRLLLKLRATSYTAEFDFAQHRIIWSLSTAKSSTPRWMIKHGV